MRRRHFLAASAAAACTSLLGRSASDHLGGQLEQRSIHSPTWSVIPVVGDGKWIWTKPPEGQTGYLESRPYELSIGVELQGQGEALQIRASTPVPLPHGEQQVDDVRIETEGCDASIQRVGEGAAQLLLAAPSIRRGQTVRAIAHYRLTLKKQYLGHERDHFPVEQPPPPVAVRKLYLGESPGIQTRAPEVRKLHQELSAQEKHPWALAEIYQRWVHKEIEAKRGNFIGVVNALKRRYGDCEEKAAVFVALCRAAGIPARLVWVPNHNWAEFYLTDTGGKGHWIPSHTSCYSWHGWTGAHELVIQKGDRVIPAQEKKAQRLLEDWVQWMGKAPASRFVADLAPLPPSSTESDPGPGARSKQASGEWKIAGNHPLDKYMRDG
jgi:transglutaminase superfamily protein